MEENRTNTSSRAIVIAAVRRTRSVGPPRKVTRGFFWQVADLNLPQEFLGAPLGALWRPPADKQHLESCGRSGLSPGPRWVAGSRGFATTYADRPGERGHISFGLARGGGGGLRARQTLSRLWLKEGRATFWALRWRVGKAKPANDVRNGRVEVAARRRPNRGPPFRRSSRPTFLMPSGGEAPPTGGPARTDR